MTESREAGDVVEEVLSVGVESRVELGLRVEVELGGIVGLLIEDVEVLSNVKDKVGFTTEDTVELGARVAVEVGLELLSDRFPIGSSPNSITADPFALMKIVEK